MIWAAASPSTDFPRGIWVQKVSQEVLGALDRHRISLKVCKGVRVTYPSTDAHRPPAPGDGAQGKPPREAASEALGRAVREWLDVLQEWAWADERTREVWAIAHIDWESILDSRADVDDEVITEGVGQTDPQRRKGDKGDIPLGATMGVGGRVCLFVSIGPHSVDIWVMGGEPGVVRWLAERLKRVVSEAVSSDGRG